MMPFVGRRFSQGVQRTSLVLLASLTVLLLSCLVHADSGSADWLGHGFRYAGTIRPRHAREIRSSNWSIGAETMDRDYTVYSHWRKFLGPLGVKKARIQSGWAKTEKRRGQYDWAWVDEIIPDMVQQGVKPWVCLCYGNPIYPGGGGTGLAGGLPTSDEALEAWDRYVGAFVDRHKGQVDEWEIWNEPSLHKANGAEVYADFFVRTARIIRERQLHAKIIGLALPGVPLPFTRAFLDRLRQQRALDLLDVVSYHPYSYNPDESYDAVRKLRDLVRAYDERITLLQGENGAPSAGGKFGALSKYDWNEERQAKWALRRLLGDLGNDIPSSYFAICDMVYLVGETGRDSDWRHDRSRLRTRLNSKGLLAVKPDKTVDHVKLAYRTVQHVTAIFDDSVTRTRENTCGLIGGGVKCRYQVFHYRSDCGGDLVTLWRASDPPGRHPDVEYVRLSVRRARYREPMLVDLLTGRAFTIDRDLWQATGDSILFKRVPLYDSVLLIAERCALPLETGNVHQVKPGALGEDVLRYGDNEWEDRSLGNHRVVIRVDAKAEALRVHVPWRRRDRQPERKNLILVDAATGKRIENLFVLTCNREFADLAFEPVTAPGEYHLYFLSTRTEGKRYYPKVTYQERVDTADVAWVARSGLDISTTAREAWSRLPAARAVVMEAIDPFHSFYPMEVIATKAETDALLAAHPDRSCLLFPEDRRHSIRMLEDLPYRWVKRGSTERFRGTAARGEFFVFQIGLWAARKAVPDVELRFGDLTRATGRGLIPARALRCLNSGGVDWTGAAFRKPCPVREDHVQPLWIGIDVPADSIPGLYGGTITVAPVGAEPQRVELELEVLEPVLEDHGDGEPWRLSRLRWLDSKLALDDGLTRAFTPLRVEGSTIHCLGRAVTLGSDGLPESITSFIAPEGTHLVERGQELLAGPIRFQRETGDGTVARWHVSPVSFARREPGVVTWESSWQEEAIVARCKGRMEFDGCIEYELILTASSQTVVNDLRLEIPFQTRMARYLMGLGVKGGLRRGDVQWRWDPARNQDAVWIGDVHAGLQCFFRDERYERPLNTNFYLSKPLIMPRSWWNDGKGGITVREHSDGGSVTMTSYSGQRTLAPGDALHFNFRLLVTPFKPINTRAQWATRFYHATHSLDEVARRGANTINNHHATDINPYINYPFLRVEEMKEYVRAAHARGMRLKIYYTVRELANRAPELFALRSLGHEIFSSGPGGGFSWLQEHFGVDYDYIAGWFVTRYEDAAIVNSGTSRWHNYYLEGLAWLVKNVGIDGLYIDDVAFDRTVMKRVRKILERGNPDALVDLHSANQYNVRDGFASSANLYLEHFPYLDRLWFGEYFDSDSPPDFWLIEMSGIPFGLMGEMLEGGGNPWRGMVYGMTARLPRQEIPARLWRFWDAFGIEESRMIGYWSPHCPVRTDCDDVLATVYARDGAALVAIASWAGKDTSVELRIDWQALGLDRTGATLKAPAIQGFQNAGTLSPEGRFTVPAGRGWLLVLE